MYQPNIKRALSMASILCLSLLLSGAFVPATEAALQSCRADPIVWLSDGTMVQMIVGLSIDRDDVQGLIYTLHAPVGTRVSKIEFTGGPLRDKESVVFYDDMAPGEYQTDTIAYTTRRNVQVTATTRTRSFTGSVSGFEQQHLVLSFTSP